METFVPYSLLHLELNQLEGWVPPGSPLYLVIWGRSQPLGHLWLESPRDLPTSYLRQHIYESLHATLRHFFSKQEKSSSSNWESLLREGRYSLLHELFEKAVPAAGQTNSLPVEKLSVIICTRNRPECLQRCIDSLMKGQDTMFELIVVDNTNGDERVRNLLLAYPAAKYVNETRTGLGIARNAGLRAASHNMIAFTDDDVEVHPGWISGLKTAFEHPLTMAVTGLVIPMELETRSQYLFERYWGFNRGYVPITFDHRFFLDHLSQGVPVWDIGAGANMAFRREVFELSGAFDERLEAGAAGCSGDTEYWYRVLAGGWNCCYLPQLVVYHQHRKTAKALRRQLYDYARGHACALLVQYEKYRHRGNLRRLYRVLPVFFLKRTGQYVKSGQIRNLASVWREARGTMAGWFYYQFRRNQPGYKQPFSLPSLPVENDADPALSLVSVIVPCYNQAGYLPDAINSVCRQTHPQVEIIVVDDGSTENVRGVCESFPNVRYLRVERVGLSAARNIGVRVSSGDFLVFLDADDFLYPNAIETQLGYFAADPRLAYVSGAHDRIDSAGNPLPVAGPYDKPTDNYCSLLLGNYIGMEATVMYRRALFFHFHFDPTLQASEDYALNLDIARRFPVLGHTQKLAVYRIHGQNMSANASYMLQMTMRVLRQQRENLLDTREMKVYKQALNNWRGYYRRLARNQSK
ncbi:MAG TPA: glycosyltransferase [Puia sp.]|nr:glycosyltransferase [Puia sp.]